MSIDLISAANTDYEAAERGGVGPLDARVAAARRFARRIAAVEADGATGLDQLDLALRDSDWFRRDTAARILSALPDPRAAEMVVAAAVRDETSFDLRHLSRLGKRQALPPTVFPPLDKLPPNARVHAATAILRHPTPRARQLADEILNGRADLPVRSLIEPLAAWGERATLRMLLDRPPEKLPRGTSRMLALDDGVPALAAMHLVLAGELDALDRLEDMTRDARNPYAGHAISCLGLLAHPRAVAPAARLLGARKLDTVAWALDAASALATPLLGGALVTVVEARRGSASLSTGSVADDAAAVLVELLGIDPPAVGRAALAFRTAVLDLDPRVRYRAGKPLTLAVLARDLAAWHAGRRTNAAWGLRAITGEDHGLDPDDDLIGNLAAFDAWHARAKDPAPVGDGGWAFSGAPIEPPG